MTDDNSALVNQVRAESAQATATARAGDPEDGHTGGIDPRTAQARLHHTQTAETAAVGPGFQFTPEQIDLQLHQCQQHLTDLYEDLATASRAMDTVHEPAPDGASVTQANAVRGMLNNTVAVIRADIAYLADWQSRLTAAKQNYLTTEHLSEQQWTGLAQEL